MIRVKELGIKFQIDKRHRARLFNLLTQREQKNGEFWALKNISFEVGEDETIGVIGRNGSGKSTLLRVIAGIYPPDKGKVIVQGEVSTLFGLGSGFQPELSGRDNIYMCGTMIGLAKKEIDDIIDEIIGFAELGEFIDMPVRTYSTGMYTRLGFSIAISVKKDIVLIDEILGAGDVIFREKADAKLEEMIGGKTVIIVSHSMNTIKKFCSRVIWLDKGIVKMIGEPEEVIKEYLR